MRDFSRAIWTQCPINAVTGKVGPSTLLQSVSERRVNLLRILGGVGDAEIELGGLKRLVTEIRLNVPNQDARFRPSRRARLAEAVLIDVLAFAACFARLAVAAIRTGGAPLLAGTCILWVWT
jgi:hypothetical protein